jgi:hypothetical protein
MKAVLPGRGGALLVLLTAALIQGGCAAPKEPYPHPYIRHKALPFSTEAQSHGIPAVPDALRLGVCDLQSQAVFPAGGYYVDGRLERLLEPIACEREVADVVNDQLAAYGASTSRLRGETGDLPLLEPKVTKWTDLLLKGTILEMEFSQHGCKKDPYDLFYLRVRFVLQRVSDGKAVWQGDVVAWTKLPPDPSSSQMSLASQTAKVVARRLAESTSFRSSLKGLR